MKRTTSKTLFATILLGTLTTMFSTINVEAYPKSVSDNGYNTVASPLVNATVEISHGALNLNGRCDLATAYIELEEGYDPVDISVASIRINGNISVDLDAPMQIGDYDGNGMQDLMVNFNRTEIMESVVLAGVYYGNVCLRLTGNVYKGHVFDENCNVEVSDLIGDANCDKKVDIYDVLSAFGCFHSTEGDTSWNPNLNFAAPWYIIDIFDVVVIIYHYGESYP